MSDMLDKSDKFEIHIHIGFAKINKRMGGEQIARSVSKLNKVSVVFFWLVFLHLNKNSFAPFLIFFFHIIKIIKNWRAFCSLFLYSIGILRLSAGVLLYSK